MYANGTKVTALTTLEDSDGVVVPEGAAGMVLDCDEAEAYTVQFAEGIITVFAGELVERQRLPVYVTDSKDDSWTSGDECLCCGRKAKHWVAVDLATHEVTHPSEALKLEAAELEGVSWFNIGSMCRKKYPAGWVLTPKQFSDLSA